MTEMAPFPRSQTEVRPRKVAVVCSYTPSLVNFRFQLLKAMLDNGHQVVAYGPERHQPTLDALTAIGVEFEQIPMSRAGLNPLQDLRTLAALYCRFHQDDPDLVLCYTMKPVIYGLIAARFAGVSERHALMTGLGYIFGEDPENRRLPLLRAVATLLYRLAFAGGGRVFVYNDADTQDIIDGRMVSNPERIVAVPGSSVDLVRFSPADVPEGDPVFLLIARLLREKGVREFVEAARIVRTQNPRARFRLLGPIDPGPLAVPEAEIEGWQSEGIIDYLGFTTDVRPHLAACTVFVLPSYYREGIPRSILEAMATGRAIVTADTPGCRDTVIDGDNGFIVPPRDPGSLAEAMLRFVRDRDLARMMGARSLEIARQRYRVERVNDLLLEQMGLLNRSVAVP